MLACGFFYGKSATINFLFSLMPYMRAFILRLITLLCASFVGLVLLLIAAFMLFNHFYPLSIPKIEPSVVVVDQKGEVLRQFADSEGIFRHWVTLDDVNPYYLNALIHYEDRYFYHHFGINPLATLRAFGQWVGHRKIISGSSTLTMQVARLLYPHERTFMGKIEQMFRAIQLEQQLTKAEILTLYINIAPMGGNIEGVQAASWRYFGKDAASLNIAESALLVALPQRPSVYRPDHSLTKALYARNKVLARLADFGEISPTDALRYQQEPINYTPSSTQFSAPLLAENLKQQSDQHVIHTTLDGQLQRKIESLLHSQSKTWPDKASGAVLVVNNHTHSIAAYVGSADLFNAERFGYVDMVMAIRSPGSTLKPFAYGMAMDYGIIHEASLLTDVRRGFDGYYPKNFDNEFRGAVPMFRALQLSLNVPVVQVFQHLTPHYFTQKLRQSGIELSIDYPTLSMILGGVGISLWEQVRLFSSLSTQGQIYPMTVTPKTVISTGQILSPEAAWITHKILSQTRPANRFNPRKIAWKTGTSYGYRDGWALGTTADWTVGVWVGRPDGVPNVGALANRYATPLLFDVFNLLPKDQTTLTKPRGITTETICWPSGRNMTDVPIEACEQQYTIDAIKGQTPPTLYDSPGEMPHFGWPQLLTDAPLLLQSAEIVTLQNQSIIYKSPHSIALTARGNPPFRWYLDGQLLEHNALDVSRLSLGQHTLSVQDHAQKVHRIVFEVRE
ncbi:penicillin-binding protein 1C [Wohlfahrtiimonas chitiniclastica]|nr:penicillin-binding protein 1C [Wohlfahrtiimonas chitiniclastica]